MDDKYLFLDSLVLLMKGALYAEIDGGVISL
jgi:hypothetical protein